MDSFTSTSTSTSSGQNNTMKNMEGATAIAGASSTLKKDVSDNADRQYDSTDPLGTPLKSSLRSRRQTALKIDIPTQPASLETAPQKKISTLPKSKHFLAAKKQAKGGSVPE